MTSSICCQRRLPGLLSRPRHHHHHRRCLSTTTFDTLAQLNESYAHKSNDNDDDVTDVTIRGWVQVTRGHKSVAFVSINDGSSSRHTQIVLEPPPRSLPAIGASVCVTGRLVQRRPDASPPYEVHVSSSPSSSMTIVGDSPLASYPFPKPSAAYTLAYTRTHAHLRARTTAFAAMLRVRSAITLAIHTFLQREARCHHIPAPTLTPLDCEGAGELFTLREADDRAPFFGTPMHLSVSGQLYAEMAACGGLSRVYTFGPTYRAEKSRTTRHLAEFWMVEPEIAYASLADIMDVTDALLRHTVSYVLEHHADDMREVHSKAEHDVLAELRAMLGRASAPRVTYTEAVRQLGVPWGTALSTEHEKCLAADGPVFITRYPSSLKPFYMRRRQQQDDDDDYDDCAGVVVECMDFLVPRVGELAGGSEREDRVEVLTEAMYASGMKHTDAYQWYVDLRRHGSVPHAGFGIGVERLMQYLTGWSNIRDVTLVPRAEGGSGTTNVGM